MVIPDDIKNLFWDSDLEKIDLEKNKVFIISRLMKMGDIRERAWLESVYSEGDFELAARKSRDLDVITANYLRKKLGLSKKDMAYYTQGNSYALEDFR